MIHLTPIKKAHVLAFLYLLYGLDKPLPRRNSRPHGRFSRRLLDGLGGWVSGVLRGQGTAGLHGSSRFDLGSPQRRDRCGGSRSDGHRA